MFGSGVLLVMIGQNDIVEVLVKVVGVVGVCMQVWNEGYVFEDCVINVFVGYLVFVLIVIGVGVQYVVSGISLVNMGFVGLNFGYGSVV